MIATGISQLKVNISYTFIHSLQYSQENIYVISITVKNSYKWPNIYD